MRYWDKLETREIDDFTVVLETSWEDIDPRDMFDDSIDDVEEICRKIDNYDLCWFMLRARVEFEGITIGEYTLGGLLEENTSDILKDTCIIDDVIEEAMIEAKDFIQKVKEI